MAGDLLVGLYAGGVQTEWTMFVRVRSGRRPALRRRPRRCAGSRRVLPAAWPTAGRRLAKFAQRSWP